MNKEWYRVAFGEVYPLVYPHRDVAEAVRVASRLVPMIRRERPTLDVGCGNGRYMSALAAEGVDVYGVDLSEFLLAEAAGNPDLSGRLVCGDMRRLPFVPGAFGSAINMFTSFGYFDSDEDNARVLGEVARVVESGGAFVLDFINSGRVRHSVRAASRRAQDGVDVEEFRELSHDGRVLVKRVRVNCEGRETVEYAERLRLYDRDELVAMLGDAGFRTEEVHGDYDLGPFDTALSPRLICICRRS
ncbi:MAG TPA: class I SAM-dependent methyltransferase [Candidatus Krumholzibacteria bacterium]|nr:class I SAM-dependent methyltransferase [Candidatus Krumholzibacteria bacterium]